MDESVRHRREFRRIPPDESTLRIEALGLGDRVEYAEIGLRIATARCGPLPATVVRGEIEIIKLLGEVRFPPSPVDTEVFR